MGDLEWDTVPGIYAIDHVPTRQRYVGATVNLMKRRRAHVQALLRGRGTCARLQSIATEHGVDSLTWVVLEYAPVALSSSEAGRWLKDAEVRWGNSCPDGWEIIVRTGNYSLVAPVGEKVVVSAEVAREFRDELDERAEVERRTRAKLIVRALRFYLAHAPVVPSQDDDIPPPKKEKK